MNKYQIESFWSKVEIGKTPKLCWLWRGAKKPSGYGNVRINGKYLLAHRVAFTLANGGIPSGYIVCHICDTPSCCNPNHLMLGTNKSNAADMLIKNRQKSIIKSARGVNNGRSKLSEEDVISIRFLYKDKAKNQYELASMFGVSQTAIGSVIRKDTWSHI